MVEEVASRTTKRITKEGKWTGLGEIQQSIASKGGVFLFW